MGLLRGARDKPAGLSSSMIDSWLSGAVQSAVPVHVAYALNRWKALPTNRKAQLTPEMSAALAAEIDRTGMDPIRFMDADDIPQGLTWRVILSWIKLTTSTLSQTHWKYVTERLRALPDSSYPPLYRERRTEPARASSNLSQRVAWTALREIEKSDLAELRHHRERTGIGGAILLKTATDKPAGLTPSMISSWITGVAKTANPELVAYVLARYRAWP